MGVLQILKRKFSRVAPNGRTETVGYGTPEEEIVRPEISDDSFNEKGYLDTKNPYDLWAQVCIEPGIEEDIKEFNMVDVYFESVCNFYDKVINKYLTKEMEFNYKLGFIKVVTSKLFAKYAEVFVLPESNGKDKPSFYNFDGFIRAFLRGLFDSCVNNNLDFFAVFQSIKDLPIYHYKTSQDFEVIRYSFSDFEDIIDRCEKSRFLDDREELNKKIRLVFGGSFKEFLQRANAKDIDVLAKSSVKNVDNVIYEYLTKNDNMFKFDNGLEAIRAIARHYPSILTYAYESYLHYVVGHVSEFPNDEIEKVLYEMGQLRRYRSEEFEYVGARWKNIINATLLVNGITVYNVSGLLSEYFSIDRAKIDEYVISSFVDFFINDDNEFVILTSNEVNYILKHLSHPDVYDLIMDYKPCIITAFD